MYIYVMRLGLEKRERDFRDSLFMTIFRTKGAQINIYIIVTIAFISHI